MCLTLASRFQKGSHLTTYSSVAFCFLLDSCFYPESTTGKHQMNPTIREVEHRIRAHRQTEGAGFSVRRPLPTAGIDQLDPFLLIDEMGPVDYAPGEAVG